MSSHHHLTTESTQDSFEFLSSKERSTCHSESIRMDTGGSATGGNDATMKATDMILVNNSESCTTAAMSSSNCNNSTAKKRAMWRMQRRSRRKAKPASGRPPKQKATSGRLGGRRQRRLWQLPQSSIDEYTKWIQEKPEADRSPNEERFLWKSMIRSLGVVGSHTNTNSTSAMALEKTGSKRSRQERIREFVDRLEAKEPMELTQMEELFVRLYHKRRKDRKAQRQQQRHEDTVVSWMRCSADDPSNEPNTSQGKKPKSKKKKNKGAGLEPQASLESLRESMNRMGLSSDKLKHVRFADPPMK